MINYQEYQPHESLRDKIDGYWILEITGNDVNPEYVERVTPLGYPELIFHFRDSYSIEQNGAYIELAKCLFTGQLTSSINFKATGQTGILGVKFKPQGAYSFIPKPLSDFTNSSSDLKGIFNAERVVKLEGELKNGPNKIEIIDRFLCENRLSSTVYMPIDEIVEYIKSKKGNVVVSELADHFNTSLSTFERTFKKVIGLSPKKFAKIIQFNEILNEYKVNKDLQSIAYKYNYYDFSHFTKEFSLFSGFSPGAFKTVEKSITENIVIQKNADFLHKEQH